MKCVIITTVDGSHTLNVPGTNEHYHSVYGAIAESQHVYINTGLKYVSNYEKHLNILEIGFGTGLNALLTLMELAKMNASCKYTAVEAFPLEEEIYTQLNYPELLNVQLTVFLNMHRSGWNAEVEISPGFILHKINADAAKINFPSNTFHLVYFDAFSPAIQPEMWTKEIFSFIYAAMKENAVLTTYCTKGDVKRALKETGFAITKLTGPAGKREILRAVKTVRMI
ncbi:MAG: tRNA (5-methylaminomethyl-2-thiouridine)(34)-methyltransferase MnmD [Bacteroidales bacterium]|jgi:tRNA U34 5-methylaminomethyl-2-thiouridine-forming methyltransferase MnmC